MGSNVLVHGDGDPPSGIGDASKVSAPDLFPGLIDRTVVDMPDGLRVGFFGLTTPLTPKLSQPSDLVEFGSLVDTAQRVAKSLKEKDGVHVIVALTHVSSDEDRAISRSVPEIDVILGGHDHEPIAEMRHHTLLFKSGQNGYWVGVVDVNIEYDLVQGQPGQECVTAVARDSVRIFTSWHMHSTRHVEEDGNVEEIVERYQRVADKALLQQTNTGIIGEGRDGILSGLSLDDAIATAFGAPLDTRSTEVRQRETTSGNLVADAMLSYYAEGIGTVGWRAAIDQSIGTLAMINGGFIRGDRLYPSINGETTLTIRDVLEELPFPRCCCLLEMRGEHLLQALEQQLGPCSGPSGSFPQLSFNAKLEYDETAQVGERIQCLAVNGQKVEKDRKYRIAVTDFVASGGDGCSSWCFGVQKDVNGCPPKRIAIVLLEYLRKRKHVDLKLGDRLVCLFD